MTSQPFVLQDPPSRMNSHKRNNSGAPSSSALGMQAARTSDSTHNTRSLDGQNENLEEQPAAPQQPAAPTFKQFMSNRPSISQRPGLGGINNSSRFSWTNSQAPQTPHDPSRDTLNVPLGRESFMTNRSSVPRFRTINSWVNQQSNRVEALPTTRTQMAIRFQRCPLYRATLSRLVDSLAKTSSTNATRPTPQLVQHLSSSSIQARKFASAHGAQCHLRSWTWAARTRS